jgi:hypothetical protein
MIKSPMVCRDFLKGTCRRADCKFLHSENTDVKAGRYKKAPVVGSKHDSDEENSNYTYSATPTIKKSGKNTENFNPLNRPVDMRILVETSVSKNSLKLSARDVVVAPFVFADFKSSEIYDRLSTELDKTGISGISELMQLWHGDTHYIANDRLRWKRHAPTFSMVIDRIAEFFQMRIEATRLNWYKDTSQWKPFHHDAAALKEDKAQVQNFTVAVSFGATRDAAFEEVKSKTVISMPQPDGWTYCFSRDVNILWKHGILQETQTRDEGRISVIAWGYVEGLEDFP